jgi:alpha-L-arabinofuranosidase
VKLINRTGATVSVVRLTLDPSFQVAPIDRRLFGSFVEHLGRCVYTGIYEPDHPTADTDGFRGDVMELTRELGVTVVRYPGGNFVSGYRWEDGVGPKEERPRRLDLAWRTEESNHVGLNEFVTWSRQVGAEPMLAVNLGTRGVQEACDLLEYANYPKGTAWSDLRIKHGVPDPHGIRLWCLGNEMDGPWQLGHKTPAEYGRLAAETARAMRRIDPSVELVACGSSNATMPTFGEWERVVLEHTYDLVDYLSVHSYYEEVGDLASFLASGEEMHRFIDAVVATADHVGATRRSSRRLKLAFDEWNVWYQSEFEGQEDLAWSSEPDLIEDVYHVADAVVVGDLLITLLNHADRVAIGCQAQLVNVIAPILTRPGGEAWRQTIFHPFALTARHARGVVLRVEPRGPKYDTKRYDEVPVVTATATHDQDTGEVSLLLVNRDQSADVTLEADVRALGDVAVAEHVVLTDGDIRARNVPADPARVRPGVVSGTAVEEGRLTARLAPVSWNLIRIAPQT